MPVVEIESLADFDRLVRAGARSARGWRVQSVDLSGRGEALAGLDLIGAVFLGCTLPDGSGARRRGALVFPRVPDVPFDAYRARLYTPEELYDGLEGGYAETLDARIYAWDNGEREIGRTLASALHDHAIDDALEEYAAGRRIVGVMGGHSARRGSPDYLAAARLGNQLEDVTVATGGGPGAMEAANLGAFLPAGGDVESVVERLASVPDFAPDVGAWAGIALRMREEYAGRCRDTLGVPTWFYGHEPPNAFASPIAKYFTNAIREDVLLRICRGGIVFLPGAAGTVQEVFQAACDDYYATSPIAVAPMVLVGEEHWTRTLPVWPLLQALAADSPMRVHLVDTVDQVHPLLSGRGPQVAS